MRKILLAALFTVTATVANAAIIGGGPQVVQRTVGGAPAGTVVNAIQISFDEQLFGQQMVVQLDSGSIFQQATFGGETAPNDALIGAFPDVEADTFVSIGGLTLNTSSSTLVVGGSTELGMNGPKQIDTAGINIAWAPSPGVVIPSGTDFPIAQVTLSGDANGSVFLFSNSGGTGQIFEGSVRNGVVSFIPEPTTCVLAGLALVGFAARRRV
ncbi:PEP-CTERM sorting domain-containing protein [Botrimarina mediterranea]|uniref:Ice-binding protein C-terminal domain-containing protein n=1 Tax=Botrimarina mediterranea TaxID=2528022 RepID=A0A518KDQ9_9BACT|nr:PEP-CTERM sorting domain-containing protein [Botrimarina mediterranea]QDV75927.1 hypothetical protein Spa11_41500 [Botrimarina mediterranea]QDV80522.1 hypothetical protein K2D_41510 [Planctomycetes bacterium K2D]